ncbi:hypothetical protein GOODEAATRI_004115 [Goodea atripinnis]|uniref:Uncharacterized protein n=1 Tax=Goodea atripinnis TaxID=208336 RepID=A0ABV0MYN7_9TELE
MESRKEHMQSDFRTLKMRKNLRGTRLTASPRDGELTLGWERSPGLRGLAEREVGCLGFRIIANHSGFKMSTGCGGISSKLMTFKVIIFAPRAQPSEFRHPGPCSIRDETKTG